LLHEVSDIVHRVVGSGIEFINIEGAAILERLAGITFATCFKLSSHFFAVDGFGENSGTGSFAHPSWPTEKEGLSEVVVFYCILERGSDVLLPYYTLEICWSVFSCRNDEIFHRCKI
jgi:hypothetical protein